MLVDDHPVVREGLRTLLGQERDIECVAEAGSGEEAAQLAGDVQPDVVLMDLMMPGIGGLAAIKLVREASPGTQVVALTSFSDEARVRAAIEAGAVGYLLKDVLKDSLVRAIRNARLGRPSLHPEAQRHLLQRVHKPDTRKHLESLTPRERDILGLIGKGQSNRTIAQTLHLTEGTVKGHVSRVLDKLGVEDRTQAALVAVREGLVSLEEPSSDD
jgi:DNA-binding NarL/FixJ family response regulator